MNNNIYPIKIKDATKPWVEICNEQNKTDDETHNLIIIEPIVGKDPLDIRDPLPLLIVNNEKICISELIYGDYNAELLMTDNDDGIPSILKVSIACLKSTSSLKHASMSTFIAMVDLLNHINDYNLKESSFLPDIIINTKSNVNIAPLNSISEMVREITAVYMRYYSIKPNIFVAFSDDEPLTEKDTKKDKKKKKKNKKK